MLTGGVHVITGPMFAGKTTELVSASGDREGGADAGGEGRRWRQSPVIVTTNGL